MKALITGAVGFIGSNVASELLQRDFEVRAMPLNMPSIIRNGGQPPAVWRS